MNPRSVGSTPTGGMPLTWGCAHATHVCKHCKRGVAWFMAEKVEPGSSPRSMSDATYAPTRLSVSRSTVTWRWLDQSTHGARTTGRTVTRRLCPSGRCCRVRGPVTAPSRCRRASGHAFEACSRRRARCWAGQDHRHGAGPQSVWPRPGWQRNSRIPSSSLNTPAVPSTKASSTKVKR